MKVLHGTWIPQAESGFVQTGGFYLWVETTETTQSNRRSKSSNGKSSKGKSSKGKSSQDTNRQPGNIHPRQLTQADLEQFLAELGIQGNPYRKFEETIAPKHFLLPTSAEQPLPSLELSRYLETELPETFEFQDWQVDCYRATAYVKTGTYSHTSVINVVKLLNDLHFIALHNLADFQLGSDLLFWYHYTQAFKEIILKDHYIPALKYRELAAGKGKKAKSSFEIYPGWEIASAKYEADIARYSEYMPLFCTCGSEVAQDPPKFYDKQSLLRHFSEYLLTEIVTHTASSAAFDKQIADSLIDRCFHLDLTPRTDEAALKEYQQWQAWRQKITRTQTVAAFHLCFQLIAPAKESEAWQLQFQVAAKQDPSLKVALFDYWRMSRNQLKEFYQQFGADFEQNLLLNLGYAARIYPKLWDGLETDQPVEVFLDLAGAFEFLRESAWVLEDAGYKVIVPAWYTPEGRRRAKLRLKPSVSKSAGGKKSKSYFSFDTLVQYQYELSIGGERVSEQEWQQLVNAKTPLVKFRGEWVELDQQKLGEMLQFWQSHQQKTPEMSLLDLMKFSATESDEFELDLDRDTVLADLLAKLNDKSRLEPIADPSNLNGTLREYQKRGVSWLNYLENLGLNGCLADDMGLGKTIQVIARLVHEKAEGQIKRPTLLIVPTSVIGNWRKEIEKFAPHLRTTVHHGSTRLKDASAFQSACEELDVVITSFTLARSDEKLLSSLEWQRVVVDEAQNIKNPKAAQTKAIVKLPSRHRLALTGTPVENRLLDLWSIFNFLNPGYLGKEAHFRKEFETPIQKDNDRVKSATLKKLVEPLILRRVKTDQAIIKDLPDKVEQKLFCNLTKEQASLYEAVVKDVEQKIQTTEGIERKGLILSTLMKLKQICNHPMQFLHDGSEFSPDRSHKLSRLADMVAEVMAEGESLLIFSQFTEIGEALEKYCKHTCHYNTYYLHGGTSRKKREQIISEFQNPETEPSIFVLSLKAGGVGITLTKANHVFHFDRWWNPAVEDQATDRAFRIGQTKNVFVHKFVAIGTLEERIDQMIEDKKKLAGAIVGSDESWLTELDNEAFKQLIALNRSAILE
jgi:SNF2 family DNA or RNA helicase